MALAFLTTTAFEKDMRRVEKQGKDLDKEVGKISLDWRFSRAVDGL